MRGEQGGSVPWHIVYCVVVIGNEDLLSHSAEYQAGHVLCSCHVQVGQVLHAQLCEIFSKLCGIFSKLCIESSSLQLVVWWRAGNP